MSNYIQRFISRAQRFPELIPVLNNISQTHGLLINNDIQITKNTQKYALQAAQNIKQNSNIIHLNVSKCLSSHNFVGASIRQNNKFNYTFQNFESLKAQKDAETIKISKIVLQLLVNLKTPQFQLHQYAKFLKNQSFQSYRDLTVEDLQIIKSERLISLIYNSSKKLDMISQQFNQKFPFVTPDTFLRMYLLARSRSLSINNQIVLAPVFDMVNHSFEPNCEIEGKFIANNSYLILKSCKNIHPGEQLTIKYGQMSNTQLFFKYNIFENSNPYSFYLLKLNYDEYESNAAVQFQMKLPLFESLGGIPQLVRVFRTKIDDESMKALRLYFLDQNDLKSIKRLNTESLCRMVSKQNQKRVYNFLLANLETAYRFSSLQYHPKKMIQDLQIEQVLVMKDAIDFLRNGIKELDTS